MVESIAPSPRNPWTWAVASVGVLLGALGGGPGVRALIGDATGKRLTKVEQKLDAISAAIQRQEVAAAKHEGEHRELETRLAGERSDRVEADSHLDEKVRLLASSRGKD